MEASKSETAWNWIRSSPGDGNSVVTASDKKMRVKRSLLIGLGRAGSRVDLYTVRSWSHLQWSTIWGEPGSWASAVLLVFDQRWIVGRFRSKNNALLPLHDCPALIPLRQMIKWSKCNNALMRLLAYSLSLFLSSLASLWSDMRSALKTYFNARDVEISNVVKVDTYTDTILDVVKCNGKKEKKQGKKITNGIFFLCCDVMLIL